MKRKYFLIYNGISSNHTALERRRIKLLNSFAIFTSVLLAILLLVNLNAGLYKMVLVDLGAFFLSVLPVFLLNRFNQNKIGVIYFISTAIIITTFATNVAFQEGRFTETENYLILAAIISILMVDGIAQKVLYLFSSLTLILLKYLKVVYYLNGSSTDIWLTVVNAFAVMIAIYIFIKIFAAVLNHAIKKAENQEAIVFSLIDNTPLHLGLIDKDWKYVLVNSNYERTFNSTRANIINKQPKDILPEELYERHKPLIEKAFKGESPEFNEYTQLPNGQDFYSQGRYTPVFNSKGEINGVANYVANVSELQNAREKLQNAVQNRDKLFSIIAHDIISPLNLFQHILSIKDDEIMDRATFFEYQEGVREKLQMLNSTINNLLQWARAQQKGINAYPKQVSLTRIVEENLKLFDELIKKKSLTVIHKTESIDCYIDEDHLKLIIRNLIHNAIKFSHLGGMIELISSCDNDQLTFRIEDFGVGLSEKKLKEILDHNTYNSEIGTDGEMGTGLGLNLCFELFKLNNCECKITSEVGKGTCIEVVIPLKKELE